MFDSDEVNDASSGYNQTCCHLPLNPAGPTVPPEGTTSLPIVFVLQSVSVCGDRTDAAAL